MKKLKVGDIILLKPNSDDSLGQQITQLTKSVFSHVMMVYSKKKHGKIKIIELIGNGINVDRISVNKGTEDDYNAYVLRLKTDVDKSVLKRSAKRLKKSKIKFDFNSLFLLYGLIQLFNYQTKNNNITIPHDHLLLVVAELINQTKKAKIKDNKTTDLAHCSQFIYDIFYNAGTEYQLQVNGGYFLSQPNTNADGEEISNTEKEIHEDSVMHISSILDNILHPLLEPLQASPIINEKRFIEIHNNFNTSMESLHPIGSVFLTPGDFMSHVENLSFVDYYNINVLRSVRNKHMLFD